MKSLLMETTSIESLLGELVQRVSFRNDAEKDLIKKAINLGLKLHAVQKRASGEPYMIHPLHVGGILASLNMDSATICAGLLHDVLEDTYMSKIELAQEMTEEIAELVDGVTKIHILHAKTKSVQESETIRKMFLAMSNDIRVILIKLADKVHNMSTLQYLPPEKIQRIATECRDLYAPLAGRLGINGVRATLEDLSLKFLDSDAYKAIEEFVSSRQNEQEQFLETISREVLETAQKENIEVSVSWRAKHFYSIYLKWKRKGHELDDIHDILGARVVCSTVTECYGLLGLVHSRYKPIEGRFKDYIAMPKENGYQSLHTTVMSYGHLTEIQIRTKEMHQTAEYGIAAHWMYKEGKARAKDIELFKRIREWSQNIGDSPDLLQNLKEEILKDTIYVFTPKGKVVQLPKGATALDFAFSIHTEVGQHCFAAKADGAIIPLGQELKNTQVIEIITAQNARPHLNWLRYARTARARGKIRHWLTHNDPSIFSDRNILAKKPEEKAPEEKVEKEKKAEVHPVIPETTQRVAQSKIGIRMGKEDNFLVKFAHCCKPLPGDAIIGFISRGRGLIIHKANCSNLKAIKDFQERRVEVEWDAHTTRSVKKFRVIAKRSPDLFSQIEGAIRRYNGHLIEGRVDEDNQGRWIGNFTMELDQEDELLKVVKAIRSIPAVSLIQKLEEGNG